MKFNAGDIVSAKVYKIMRAVVIEANQLSWDGRAYCRIQDDAGRFHHFYNEYLKLVEPILPKEEQLLRKIKQLWERQDYVKNFLTLG